ncbi:hypothetical protein [Ulvibacter antarcticus]|uniref:Uncharacterized protein n=1 Tax=Ulvibacter antarcticus TaxID=442714 RepID=A0A3L9Z3N1_9FLAO|nr:hypothetical protein [Ulvibacter antarcticus]RMA66039.1 hypothetical protein BXY75_0456 [Ulvibacter antarcticus]
MKKLIFTALVIGLVATSCKKDDNGDEGSGACQTCVQAQSGASVEYCDNGDGTYSATTSGTTINSTLGGLTFGELITSLELAGVDCN